MVHELTNVDSPKSTSTPAPLPQTRPTSFSTTSSTTSSTISSSTSSSTTSSQTSSSATSEQETSSQTTFSTQISSSSTPATSTLNDLLSPSGVLVSQTAGPTQTSAVPTASGLSTVATVGMIAGACAIFLVLGAFAAFFYRRKAQKKMAAAYGKTEDEKSGVSGGNGGGVVYSEKLHSAPTVMYSEKAPRISVRPVTEFMPNLNGPPAAATAATATAAAAAAAVTTRPVTNTPSTGLSAAPSETRKAPPPALSIVTNEPTQSSPFTGNSEPSGLISPTGSGFIDVGAAGGAAGGAAAGAAAAALMNPVHRVQMDFKPSMGDEIELRGGALVRLLHEYDDGWALCTRLDRSQQGVCPRTCLSQRPVKPRPQGAPESPPQVRVANGRPQSPIVIRPYNAGPGSHPQSPITGPNRILGQPQRPQSPAMPRSPGLGYVKAQYRPASAQSPVQSHPSTPTHTAPQSPIGSASPPPSLRVGPPLITISTALESGPSNNTPQSPVSTPSPTFAPVKPSPLSNEQTASIPTAGTEERKEKAKIGEKTEGEQLVFHAM